MKAELKCTVIDNQTGEKIPARASVEDLEGNYYSPPDALSYGMNMPPEWPSDWGIKGQQMYFYADGEFNLTVPIGRVKIKVMHGYEYRPSAKLVEIFSEGKEITIKLKRIINMPASGWFCGDNHVHLTHAPKEYELGAKEGLFLARAEGLNTVSFLDPPYGNISRSDKTAKAYIHFGLERGHYPVLGLTRRPPENFTGRWVALNDWAHDQKGTISMGHPFSSNHLFSGLFTADKATAAMCHYELPISIALGKVDTFDLQNNRLSGLRIWLRIWYSLLNCGFRIPLSAGTDACHSVKTTLPLGIYRVYVKADAADYKSWLQGLKRGKSFLTDGPLLFLRINGAGPGATIYLNKHDRNYLMIEIRAISGYGLDSVALIQNGKVVKQWKLRQAKSFKIKYQIKISKSSWLALRVYRERGRFSGGKELFAHTSPVYIFYGQEKISSSKDAMFFLEWIDYFCRLRLDKNNLRDRNILEAIENARRQYLCQLTSSDKRRYLAKREKIKSIELDDFKETGPNLIKNSGYYWKASAGSKSAVRTVNKYRYLELTREGQEKYTASICYQQVAVKPGTYYTLKGEINRAIGENAGERGGYTVARIIAMDENGNYLGGIVDETKGGQWVEASALIYAEKKIRAVMIACYMEYYGKVGFRSISLKECQGPFLNLI